MSLLSRKVCLVLPFSALYILLWLALSSKVQPTLPYLYKISIQYTIGTPMYSPTLHVLCLNYCTYGYTYSSGPHISITYRIFYMHRTLLLRSTYSTCTLHFFYLVNTLYLKLSQLTFSSNAKVPNSMTSQIVGWGGGGGGPPPTILSVSIYTTVYPNT